MKDYRSTILSVLPSDISDLKIKLHKKITEESKLKNMYSAVNDRRFKSLYRKVYEYKCAYCGVNNYVRDHDYFEVDHYYPQNPKFGKPHDKVDTLENLVLACFKCNRAKGNLTLPNSKYAQFHPDTTIKDVFKRHKDFSIVIDASYASNEYAIKIYNKLELYSQFRRLDYLLMELNDLIYRISKKREFNEVCKILFEIKDELREKRNRLLNF